MSRSRACLTVALVALLGFPAAAAQARRKQTRTVERVFFSTVPATKGLTLHFPGGRSVRTDAGGRAAIRLPVTSHPGRNLRRYRRLRPGFYYRSPTVRPLRRVDGSVVHLDRFFGSTVIALDQTSAFAPRFVGQGGRPLAPGVVQRYTVKSRTGAVVTVDGASPVRLQSSRVTGGLVRRDVQWAIQSVIVDGANVVTRGRNRFSPRVLRGPLEVPLLFFSVRVTSADAFFGSPVGTSVSLTYPSGRKRRIALSGGTIVLNGLPRGDFKLKVNAPGMSPERPLALSRDQDVELKVISYLDLALAGGLLGALAVLLLVVRRPHLRRLRRRPARSIAEPSEIEMTEPVAS